MEGHSTDLSVSCLDYGEVPRKVRLREMLFSLFNLDCLWRKDSVEVERCSSQLYCVVYLRHPCIMTRRGIKRVWRVIQHNALTSEICQSLAPKMKSQSPKQSISIFNARLLTQGTRIQLMSSPCVIGPDDTNIYASLRAFCLYDPNRPNFHDISPITAV